MSRKLPVGIAVAMVFVLTVLILLRVVPGPHRPADYAVIGSLATLVCILVVFLVFLSGNAKRSEMFYKRKKTSAKS